MKTAFLIDKKQNEQEFIDIYLYNSENDFIPDIKNIISSDLKYFGTIFSEDIVNMKLLGIYKTNSDRSLNYLKDVLGFPIPDDYNLIFNSLSEEVIKQLNLGQLNLKPNLDYCEKNTQLALFSGAIILPTSNKKELYFRQKDLPYNNIHQGNIKYKYEPFELLYHIDFDWQISVYKKIYHHLKREINLLKDTSLKQTFENLFLSQTENYHTAIIYGNVDYGYNVLCRLFEYCNDISASKKQAV